MIEVIGPEELRGAVTWPRALDAVRSALAGLAAGSVLQPSPVELRMPHQGGLHVKGGHLVDSRWIVIKVATGGFPDGPPTGCLLLVDAFTGAPRWLLDDQGWLTQQRTAAAGALATLELARPDARSLLILGTGALVPSLVEAHRAVAPHLHVTVWGRDATRTAQLCDDAGVARAEDLESAISSTDVLVTATSSTAPLFEGHWVRPGTHVTAMGADTAGKQELPPALLRRADLLVCDDVATSRHAGELQHADAETVARAVSWSDLAGSLRTRTAAAVTVADLCGIGAEDAAIAAAALEGRLLS